MTSAQGPRARAALASRLRAVAAVMLPDLPHQIDDPAHDAARVLSALTESVLDDPTDSRIWLVMSGISAAYPTRDEVDQTRRTLELSTADESALYLLESGLSRAMLWGEPTAPIEVVAGRVIVDVDFTARHDLHSGIQRVVRSTLPHWNVDRQITPAAWNRNVGILRNLDPAEAARIYQWSLLDKARESPNTRRGSGTGRRAGIGEHPEPDGAEPRVLIPFECVIVLPEVPPVGAAGRIAALGACSDSGVVAIGYDTIPLISADTVSIEEPTKFMPYLSALKFADRIAGISDSAAEEFASFAAMLSTQGLAGPRVVSVPLPADLGGGSSSAVPAATESPSVVVVGSRDPRKNHLAILHAAELLWQEGLDFQLTFIGAGGSNQEFYRRVELLEVRGRQVDVRLSVSEAELNHAVASARFTVFPSLHEGYGLPVAESIALGTPVITTNFGSTAEIAAGGGALTVDPYRDAALTDAMRLLLTDDTEIARLRAEIHGRTERSWQTYADELWAAIVEPGLSALARPGVHEGR